MLDIFILAGQSNMVGINSLTPAQSYTNQSRISVYQQPWNSTYGQPVKDDISPGAASWISNATDPIHSDPQCGIGPGMAFADEYLTLINDPTRTVGLIPCGWGGTSLWTYPNGVPADWAPQPRRWSPYGMMIARSLAVKASGIGTIKGFLWYQGEADANYSSQPYWTVGLETMLNAMRNELQLPNLPVVITKLGPKPSGISGYSYWNTIQNQQGYAAGISSRMALVDASDLSTNNNADIHLNASSQITLGHRMAQAIVSMG